MSDSKKIRENNDYSPQCKHFVQRKKRYCRMTVRPGKFYCGEHDPAKKSDGDEVDTRIPCPLDPKHTCYASKLEKHLQICNARQGELPPYICLNVNNVTTDVTPRIPLNEVSKETLDALVEKINHLFEKIIENTISPCKDLEIHSIVLPEFSQVDRAETSLRHLRQVSSLLHILEDEGLAADNTCYVELGAGRGHLSYYMWRAWCAAGASGALLVERASLRHKRENRAAGAGGGTGRVRRLRADLAHLALHLAPAPAPAAARLVGVAKHLCGVATDLALRCMTSPEVLPRSRGLVLATCCHHRCELHNYVATQHLQELGITKEELNIMLGVTSWATCGDGYSRERRKLLEEEAKNQNQDGDLNNPHKEDQNNHEPEGHELRGNKLTREQRELVGRRAKAILDWGRVLYLRTRGFQARLCHFVTPSVSLENVCIVAKK